MTQIKHLNKGILFLLISMLLVSCGSTRKAHHRRSSSRYKGTTYKAYISHYADACIEQMEQHLIPASITMAQGLLESGAGKSTLAKYHNNHFGIKCHRSWQGRKTYRDDDRKHECFRSYERVEDSFLDHSNFLKQRRYRRLYSYRKTDYKRWARGLQKAGYATDRGYANKLISIIENYELYELDRGRYPSWMKRKQAPVQGIYDKSERPRRQSYSSYDLLYVVAEDGDTFTSIGKEMGIKAKKLAKYNDLPLDYPLRAGDIVYLERKNKQATKAYRDHVIVVGDSMHSISQRYGIRLDYLYRINHLDMENYVPQEGDVLLLR